MNAFTNWMEKYFVPVAAKIGSQKHLVALRDSFIATMPITMAGSIAVLLNALLRDIPTEYGWTGITNTFQWLIGINGFVWWGTLAILSMTLAFAVGYNFANAYDVNPIAGGLVAFSAFIITIPQSISGVVDVTSATPGFETILTEGMKLPVDFGAWGNLNVNFLNTGGLFTALLIGAIATIVFAKLMNANIVIKLPEEVPPAVSRAFAAIIPGLVALYLVATAAWLTDKFAATLGAGNIPTLINTYFQKPFMALSQNLIAVVIISLFVSLFWFFGLHGPNVLAPALDGIYGTALNENINYYEMHKTTEGLPISGLVVHSMHSHGWVDQVLHLL